MFAPDVEARFKKIDVSLAAAVELLHRSQMISEARRQRFKAVERAMNRGLRRLRTKMKSVAEVHIRLADTIERFLKARANGGSNDQFGTGQVRVKTAGFSPLQGRSPSAPTPVYLLVGEGYRRM